MTKAQKRRQAKRDQKWHGVGLAEGYTRGYEDGLREATMIFERAVTSNARAEADKFTERAHRMRLACEHQVAELTATCQRFEEQTAEYRRQLEWFQKHARHVDIETLFNPNAAAPAAPTGGDAAKGE